MIIHGACNKVTCMNMTMHMMIMRMQNDKRHKCNMTKMGMAMQYNQMMNMMQEAKYDNGSHRSWALGTQHILGALLMQRHGR